MLVAFLFQRRTPLMRAAERGFVEAVQTLLNANARIDIRDLNGNGIISPSTVLN
jgi:ankyrin repeat protein